MRYLAASNALTPVSAHYVMLPGNYQTQFVSAQILSMLRQQRLVLVAGRDACSARMDRFVIYVMMEVTGKLSTMLLIPQYIVSV